MADLFKIKAGDTLKIPVEVTYADNAAGAPVRIVGDFMSTLVDGGFDCAAWQPEFLSPVVNVGNDHLNYIAILKTDPITTLEDSGSWYVFDELVWVTSDDPAQNILWRKQDCELTEAPE